MSTSRRFYPEWAPRLMSLVLSEHMSNSAFSQTSEAWLSQDSIAWMPLINFLLLRPPFQVFNLGILFVVKPPFRVFNLTSHFVFSFHFSSHFLWFKLPFWVFTLNLSFFFFFSFPAKTALLGFQLWQVFLLVASSIILLDYINIDRTGELFPIHFDEYQCSS